MLIVPERFVLLATPRTGSRALEQTFIGGISTHGDAGGEHHVHPEDVNDVAEKIAPGASKLPKYTVCRNPVDHLRSWYHHVNRNTPVTLSGFLTFIREADISWYFTPSLNPYQTVADEIFPYERNGIITAYRISHRTGASIIPKTEAPVIGASTGLNDTWLENAEVRQAVNERFQDDMYLYRSLVHKYDQP